MRDAEKHFLDKTLLFLYHCDANSLYRKAAFRYWKNIPCNVGFFNGFTNSRELDEAFSRIRESPKMSFSNFLHFHSTQHYRSAEIYYCFKKIVTWREART
uniref:Uncharacterized protein n=1 Tax=Caenorhabditis japonica TaxID=281687 RepID=A0A8R1E7T1_CAEJA